MASLAFKPLQQTRCKFHFHHSFNASSISTMHAFIPRFSLFIHLEAKLPPRNTIRYNNTIASDRNRAGFSSTDRRRTQNTASVVEDNGERRRVLLKDRHAKTRPKMDPQFSKSEGRMKGSSAKTQDGENGRRMGRNSNKTKDESPENMLRIGLDMCSKTGDVTGAIRLYDMSRREGVKLGKYHYAVLLYLCSSAAGGVVQPAKSGSGSRKLTSLGLSNEVSNVDLDCSIEQQESRSFSISQLNNDSVVVRSDDVILEPYPESLDGMVELLKSNADKRKSNGERGGAGIEISEDVKNYALQRGFEIYESMLSEKIPMNEATFTSVARMAMSLGDGDMAFEIVKQMAESGESPRLRSYGPALSVFCNNGDVEKAFMVEKHMLEQGVCPEEPELEALLKASVEAGRGDKVYDLLHKLRTSVRQVLPSTAELIEKWFRSNVATKVGKKKWSQKMITDAIRNGGGGWHGLGWMGKGKWSVSHTSVGSDGFCSCCGEKLVTIDLDPAETEEFAKSVASLALEREKNASFEKFQKWLDYYGPFEAVVDAANIGLYSQRSFRPSKVNAVVNGIRQVLPSKRWPLIVLHNRRVSGDPKMNEPANKAIVEKWQNADALYATPTGSNDDWYWLYAAIKFRGLLVTNDEMRDHLFQLLGKDFFPKWKERHQVRFTFSETGPVFHMPPPCSVVIQESEKGHWHVPIVSEAISHGERTWLCITRTPSLASDLKSSITHEESQSHSPRKKKRGTATSSGTGKRSDPSEHGNHGHHCKEAPREKYENLTSILSSSLLSDTSSDSVLQDLELAEDFGGCTIDYQI